MKKAKCEFLGTAFRAAILAGECISDNIGKISQGDIGVKQASDFVTSVDRESEQIIINIIKAKFPHHHFLAEESLKETAAEYRWIIDPLDGTTNYIHGYPAFSLSIALEHKGEIILGLIYDPLRDDLFTAEKGSGAFLNGRPIKVSSVSDMADSLIATGFPFRKRDLIDPYLKLFKNVFNRVSDIRRAGSAALDLAYVASGKCDGFFELSLGPWDMAAGSLIVKEAGGIVTDFSGGSDYLSSGNIVVAAPAVHGEILKEVKGIFAGTIDK
ncbi:MAG: inositol monophosphatase [Nitrospirae bacterium]|nr:inositol monophosphatase [Nitrospirota bacterium]